MRKEFRIAPFSIALCGCAGEVLRYLGFLVVEAQL